MKRPVLWLAIAAHTVLALCYAFTTPAFEAPDEADHFRAASYLAHARRLPYVPGTAARHGATPGLDEEQVAHHPPLYYGILAAWMTARGHRDTTFSIVTNPDFNAPGRPSRHLQWRHGYDEIRPHGWWLLWELRLLSVLCGAVALLCTHRIGLLVFPGRPGIADLAVLLMASLPMFSFACGALDNGNLAMAFCHATVWAAAWILVRGGMSWHDGVLLGTLAGLALMAKMTAIGVLPLLLLVYVRAWRQHDGSAAARLGPGLVALAILAILTGWFFVRNQTVYGDPLAQRAHAAAFAAIALPAGEAWEWISGGFLPQLLRSLLGNLGSMVLPMPAWFEWTAGVVAVLAAVGLGEAFVRRDRRPPPWLAALLVLAVLGAFAIVVRFNLTYVQPQGRYLFCALGPLFLLIALGLHTLIGRRLPNAPRTGLRLGAAVLPPLLGAGIYAWHFRPAFDPSLAPAGPRHAALVAGITTAPHHPRIQALAPADGASLTAPPTFRWRPARADALHSIHIYDARGRIWIVTHSWFHAELAGDAWQMSDVGWQLLPAGTELHWIVREIPDRSKGETGPEMAASAPARFTRRR